MSLLLQIANRARRLGLVLPGLPLLVANTYNLEHVLNTEARAIVLDSIQTVSLPGVDSAPGTVKQVMGEGGGEGL